MPPTVPGDQEDVLGAVGAEPVVDGRLIAQVELVSGGGEDVGEALALEAAENGGADQAGVTGDIDAGVCWYFTSHCVSSALNSVPFLPTVSGIRPNHNSCCHP